MTENQLTLDEKSELIKLRNIINNAAVAFIEAGTALAAIRDRKLYRAETKTFEEFCQRHWGYKKAHAYRLIDSAAIAKTSPIGDKIKNEAQARALKRVPASNHAEVLAEAGKTGPVTAKNIKNVINERKNKDDLSNMDGEPARVVAGPSIIKDTLGIRVPDKALTMWNRGGEVHAMMKQLSDIKCQLEKALKAGDKLFVEVGNSTIADLMMIRQSISYALPYTVCPTCNGQLIEKCSLCRGRGVVSKELYGTVPVEIRSMRERRHN